VPADDEGGDITEPTSGEPEALPPPPEPHHRNVQGGAARAAVFGVTDGLVSNVALVLGVAGGHPGAGVVRLAGLVGLLAGSVSMAAGEYISMTAQAELLERELEMERLELRRRPESERRELVAIYRSRGVKGETAEELATELMSDPDLALETHASEELESTPTSWGRPGPPRCRRSCASRSAPWCPWCRGSSPAAGWPPSGR
jgi:VIT1/CCC1 family predicted Fe2+/Mn2+ transporter